MVISGKHVIFRREYRVKIAAKSSSKFEVLFLYKGFGFSETFQFFFEKNIELCPTLMQ